MGVIYGLDSGSQDVTHKVNMSNASNIDTRLGLAVQTIAMADAAVTLVVGKASSTQVQLVGSVLYVDSDSSTLGENLLLPPEADWSGPLYVVNTGGEYVHVQTDAAGALESLASGEVGTFFSDGTTIYGEVAPVQGTGMWDAVPSPTNADPSVLHTFFDDFLLLDASWTVTEDSGGATQAVGDAPAGVVTLTNASGDNDGSQITWAQETFRMILGKRIWFEARIRCAAGDATNLDFFVGLCATEDLTGVADNMPANGFGFHKDDGDTNIDLSTSDGGTNVQSAAVHTLVDDTWVKLGLLFDGAATGSGTITPYIDGTAGTAITAATYATMVEVAPMILIRNGDGSTTQTLEVDYVKVVQER